MPSTEYKRIIRKRLWDSQDGKCCFCHCDTILPEDTGLDLGNVLTYPENMATIEHINSRLTEYRKCKKEYRANRTSMAMSCYKCNQGRMKIEHAWLKGRRKIQKRKGIVYSTEKLCR